MGGWIYRIQACIGWHLIVFTKRCKNDQIYWPNNSTSGKWLTTTTTKKKLEKKEWKIMKRIINKTQICKRNYIHCNKYL